MYDSPEPVNLGSGLEVSISELAGIVRDATGYDGRILWDPSRPNGQPRRALDTSRARMFGFQSSTSLCDGIRETVEWYRSNK
jgi:GDP-L-fucose synthase